MIEEQDNDSNELSESESELTAHIINLSTSLSYLMEIDWDAEALSQVRKKKLARMKRRIFDALDYYCESLPEIDEKD
jgi:hypothetical protein